MSVLHELTRTTYRSGKLVGIYERIYSPVYRKEQNNNSNHDVYDKVFSYTQKYLNVTINGVASIFADPPLERKNNVSQFE